MQHHFLKDFGNSGYSFTCKLSMPEWLAFIEKIHKILQVRHAYLNFA